MRVMRYLLEIFIRSPRRYSKVESLGSLEIQHQKEPRGLLDRQIGRLRALENLVYKGRSTPEEVPEAFAIAHQPPNLHVIALREYRGQPVSDGKLRDPPSI